jgi:hypothetical protein
VEHTDRRTWKQEVLTGKAEKAGKHVYAVRARSGYRRTGRRRRGEKLKWRVGHQKLTRLVVNRGQAASSANCGSFTAPATVMKREQGRLLVSMMDSMSMPVHCSIHFSIKVMSSTQFCTRAALVENRRSVFRSRRRSHPSASAICDNRFHGTSFAIGA